MVRAHRRDPRRSIRAASASRRRRPSGWASPGAARASPPAPSPPCACRCDATRRARCLRLHPAMLVATLCGVGFAPKAPGTWGSLAALPFAWLVARTGRRGGARRRGGSVFAVGMVGGRSRRAHARQGPADRRGRRGGGAMADARRGAARSVVLRCRLRALPPVRHREAVAGELGRPAHRRRLRHHVRRHRWPRSMP